MTVAKAGRDMVRRSPSDDEETKASLKRAQNREHVRAFRQRAKLRLAEQRRVDAERSHSTSTASNSPSPTEYAIARYSDLSLIDQQPGILEALIHDARKVVVIGTLRDATTVCQVDPIIRSALYCASLRSVAYFRNSKDLAASACVAYQDTLQRLRRHLAVQPTTKAVDVPTLTVALTALSDFATLEGIPDAAIHVSGRLAVFSQAGPEAFQTPWGLRVLCTFWLPYVEEAMLERRKCFLDSERWRRIPELEQYMPHISVPGLIEECDQAKKKCDEYQGIQSMSALCDMIKKVVEKCYAVMKQLSEHLETRKCDPEGSEAAHSLEHERAFIIRFVMILAYNTRRLREQVMIPIFPGIATDQLPDTQERLEEYAAQLFRSLKIILSFQHCTLWGYTRGMVKHLEFLRQHYMMSAARQSTNTELRFCNDTLEEIKNDRESVLSYHWGKRIAGAILPPRKQLTGSKTGRITPVTESINGIVYDEL